MAGHSHWTRESSAPCLRVLRIRSAAGYAEPPRMWVLHAGCPTMGAVPRWAPLRTSAPIRSRRHGATHTVAVSHAVAPCDPTKILRNRFNELRIFAVRLLVRLWHSVMTIF